MRSVALIENWLEKHSISNYKISKDLKVSVNNSVNLSGVLTERKLPFKFDYIEGYFDISDNKLDTLEGCPNVVARNFNCSNNNLDSLKYSPQKVGNFNCSYNQLKNLIDSPIEINGSYNCNNNEIISLKGITRTIKGDFDCSNNKLSSLRNAPKSINGIFDCSNNILSELLNGPVSVQKDYICYANKFSKLDGLADEIGEDLITDLLIEDVLNVHDTEKNIYRYKASEIISKIFKPIVSLTNKREIIDWLEYNEIKNYRILDDLSIDVKGNVRLARRLPNFSKLPVIFNIIDGHFDISNNELITLEGSPRLVKGDFLAFKNNLVSLKGCPTEVEKNFIVLKNNITTLKYSPVKIHEDFICSYNPLKSFEGINTVLGSIFSSILIPELEYQKYIYHNIATYKYSGPAISKYLDKKSTLLTEEERIFENNKKNLHKAISKLLDNNTLKRDMVSDVLINNLTKYDLTDLKKKVLEIKNPKGVNEKVELTENEILKMAFDTEL